MMLRMDTTLTQISQCYFDLYSHKEIEHLMVPLLNDLALNQNDSLKQLDDHLKVSDFDQQHISFIITFCTKFFELVFKHISKLPRQIREFFSNIPQVVSDKTSAKQLVAHFFLVRFVVSSFTSFHSWPSMLLCSSAPLPSSFSFILLLPPSPSFFLLPSSFSPSPTFPLLLPFSLSSPLLLPLPPFLFPFTVSGADEETKKKLAWVLGVVGKIGTILVAVYTGTQGPKFEKTFEPVSSFFVDFSPRLDEACEELLKGSPNASPAPSPPTSQNDLMKYVAIILVFLWKHRSLFVKSGLSQIYNQGVSSGKIRISAEFSAELVQEAKEEIRLKKEKREKEEKKEKERERGREK
eukprot:TRINITY_DN5196_c0_g3_i8.p1 TRINITY_DN5196_c0_g3~~TRINITY_DN5196_c0_g3_i8.p1  ORF type:complete len:351 (-),score=124.13 TRINITY_DN5196_c0_g3_i8:146-1198(-)